MQTLVIQTQHKENYGAHNWDGTGECPQHWKFKGGNTYFVSDLTSKQINKIAQGGIPTLEKLIDFTTWIKEKIKDSKDDANAASNDYLKVLGYVALGHSWLKVLEVSFKEVSNNKKFYEDKIQTAKFYFHRVLPRVESHYSSAISGSGYIMDFKFN